MSSLSSLTKNPKAVLGLVVAGVALLVAASWFLLITPKKSEANDLTEAVAAKQAELTQRQAELAAPSAQVKVKASDLYRLTKALPDSTDMAAVLLDVNRLVAKNKLNFRSVVPGTAIVTQTSAMVPMTLTVQGRFTSVSGFLRDVRTLVRVRNGRLDARCRTYSVTQVDLGQPSEAEFPIVKATITLNAHSFVQPAPPAAPAPSTPSSSDAGGTVAAGVTP